MLEFSNQTFSIAAIRIFQKGLITRVFFAEMNENYFESTKITSNERKLLRIDENYFESTKVTSNERKLPRMDETLKSSLKNCWK